MYLKALEIQGFKSFPDKTVLNFGESITAIVGPNGSGKSNISDAICWVMGEQSARSLRGDKMEDVIFGGTEKRGPVGFAQVTLVLDNGEGMFPAIDSSEVMVTRRYYRSGESEYYINKQSVRLKDVNELFMDTGLGREGYSIVGQGRIDEILSARSADRREIFEEAAGISKFRHRKEESERRLQRTQENLVRINDKIGELELQVNPLREQAETARRFLLLRDEQRTLEISLWIERLEEITEGLRCPVITFGLSASCDYYATDITYGRLGCPTFTLHDRKGGKRSVSLSVPGEHNICNALAALALADFLAIDSSLADSALQGYQGTDRRFQHKGTIGGVTVIDDYAHHPTEITATLKAAANYPHRTLWCVFQPHTYTRTKAFLKEFAQALCLADRVVLADIFAARETDTLGIDSQTLQREIQALGHECHYFPSFDEIENFLLENCINGDLLITMGAGDVVKIGENLLGR